MRTLRSICIDLENGIIVQLKDYLSAVSAREDSRAFGAMIERRITETWVSICEKMGVTPLRLPGRRSIFDCAFEYEGKTYGLDVKTKDLDSTSYSDGGICAVGNLLKFMANEHGVFLMVEVGHSKSENANARDIQYIHVAPFSCMPYESIRIENLGTGQLRLNDSVKEVYELIDWSRTKDQFFEIFTALTLTHYKRVARDAQKRIDSINAFKERGFKDFKFGR
jgi:hypothetical protein